jgi:hypothetical protein
MALEINDAAPDFLARPPKAMSVSAALVVAACYMKETILLRIIAVCSNFCSWPMVSQGASFSR